MKNLLIVICGVAIGMLIGYTTSAIMNTLLGFLLGLIANAFWGKRNLSNSDEKPSEKTSSILYINTTILLVTICLSSFVSLNIRQSKTEKHVEEFYEKIMYDLTPRDSSITIVMSSKSGDIEYIGQNNSNQNEYNRLLISKMYWTAILKNIDAKDQAFLNFFKNSSP